MKTFDISDTFKIQKHMMSIMGYWHREKSSTPYKVRGALTMLIFLIAYLGMVMQFINDIDDFKKLSEILYMMTSYTSYFCKLIGYLYSRQSFLMMLRHLKEPIFVDYHKDFEHHLTKGLRLSIFITKLYRISCAMVVILFSLYPLFDNKSLPTPVPFDMGKYAFLMYIIESFALLIAAWNNFCLDTLCICLLGLAAGQFDILKDKISNLKKSAKRDLHESSINACNQKRSANERSDEVLSNFIVHHNALIEFVQYLEDIFSFGLLAQLIGSIVVICNTGFFLLLVSPASLQFGMLFSYFITMMAQLSLYCWYGNEIMLKSVEVGECCYLSEWYTCSLEVKKSLFIIMERSKRPLSISALKFTKLSLASFTSIIQWSYSYFALLQRLASKIDKEYE